MQENKAVVLAKDAIERGQVSQYSEILLKGLLAYIRELEQDIDKENAGFCDK